MPHTSPFRQRKCKICKKSGVYISNAGLCPDCALQKCAEVGQQIKDKKGKHYQSWKQAMKKYLNLETSTKSDG